MTRYAKILKQQITRKNIAECKIADRLSVIDCSLPRSLLVRFSEVKIQRSQPSFDIEMFDYDKVILDTAGIGTFKQ